MKPITEEDLHAFVDGALDEGRRQEVETYLATNREAMARVSAYRNHSVALRSALDPIADEPIPVRLNLRHMVPSPVQPRPVQRWRYAAAAALFLAVGATGGWVSRGIFRGEPGGIIALANEASASYRAYAFDKVRPIEVRAAEADSLREMARATIGAETLPDLSMAGYRLMGGRTVATIHGPALMLMYDDDNGGRLVILGRKMASDKDSSMRELSQDGVSGWTWSRSGVGYSLVGEQASEQMRKLADQVKDELAREA
ncbi:anti-sigma factor RsiW [Rhizobium leguminosarum]|uniref:Anti-sigma factor RsiW n=1 Tax=Rhizobium leguminosarum TaxID=384 RepID=A0AAE2SYF4_RHILE|nr:MULTISPECIES: anti-sigma factor [Rhizobium]MBB4291494.1 anti-sigma factor RsiW [Rhizobium leguminosarum]MBB4296191.1 anti-sigma factor RsiW [Rhizobium leguminosarum]MBB4308550.1 anti-sigma factor RsiW [Rhizobium leguminosarum]MBB4416385.1 anti-sigma factor RsiW [Rhizobium leguminosarum]MBB4430648.1 anti-sigma factor RsiW [Rhizobium esperanzae]